jgi:hypothetical protein
MIEFLKHILGLCGEPHGLMFWIVTGTSALIIVPLKGLYYKLVCKKKKN